ncbi:MAG: hypothetical protein M1831_006778 [Alyxoria varia]|nr:MAG: hypothetical protein M1831_006778 [Alyxoria varia]
MSPNKSSEESAPASPTESEARKRVTKACDRCRLKKIKCDGLYVEYLEDSQQLLVKALKKSWTQSLPAGTETQPPDDPSVHAILQDLGVLSESAAQSSSGEGFRFDEDLENVRHSLEEGPSYSNQSLSSSQAPSRVPSRPTSDAPSPVNLSPTMERRGVARGFPEQGIYPNQYARLPQVPTSMSLQEHQATWFDTTPISHSATYPTLFPPAPDPEWNFNQPGPMSQFDESIGQSGQEFADWTSAGGSQQPQRMQQQQHQWQLQQQRPMDPSMTSQGQDSTISPAQLSLPVSFQPYDQTNEEAWSQWLNERRQ